MPQTVDNLIAMRVLYKLVQPFDKTDAFKLGVIDKDGTLLVKIKDQTPEQKEAYTYLDRLVFNLKRLIGKVPGGKSTTASLVAALYLVKESKGKSISNAYVEYRFNELLEAIDKSNVILVEEQIVVEKFIEEDGAPVNVTGAAVSTDIPVIKKKKKSVIARRMKAITT